MLHEPVRHLTKEEMLELHMLECGLVPPPSSVKLDMTTAIANGLPPQFVLHLWRRGEYSLSNAAFNLIQEKYMQFHLLFRLARWDVDGDIIETFLLPRLLLQARSLGIQSVELMDKSMFIMYSLRHLLTLSGVPVVYTEVGFKVHSMGTGAGSIVNSYNWMTGNWTQVMAVMHDTGQTETLWGCKDIPAIYGTTNSVWFEIVVALCSGCLGMYLADTPTMSLREIGQRAVRAPDWNKTANRAADHVFILKSDCIWRELGVNVAKYVQWL
jgi:hypothetical protein